MRIATRLTVALVAAFALLQITTPANAAPKPGITTVTIYHEPVTTTSVTGSGLGTVRTFFAPIAINGKAADGQYLTGKLTTVAQGLPDNQEIRESNLIFVLGDIKDQLVLGGGAMYPSGSAVLAVGVKVIRPVLGGTGKYAGAAGEAISTNLGAQGWTHVFKIRLP